MMTRPEPRSAAARDPGAPFRVRPAPGTYVVASLLSALFLAVGIVILKLSVGTPSLKALEDRLFGAALLAAAVSAVLCLQRIEIIGSELSVHFPLRRVRRCALSSITYVHCVWVTAGRGSFRTMTFGSGRTRLFTINPKLFTLRDLATLLETVRIHSPGVTLDGGARWFLR